MRNALILSCLLLAAPLAAEEEAKWSDKVKADGFVEAYYKLNPNGKQALGSTIRTFDTQQNGFAVGGGRLGLKTADGTGVLDLYLGDYAEALQAGSLNAAHPAVLGQAYVAQAFGPLTATLGLFMTHVGFEVADSVANWNFTRSLLYGQVPFYHTGLKLAYAAPIEGLGLMVQVDNGNSTLVKSSEAGGAGAQVSYTGVKGLAVYLNYYFEQVATYVPDKKHYADAVLSLELPAGLSFAGEYLYWTYQASGDKDAAGDVLSPSFMIDPADGKKVAYSPKTQGYALYLNWATPLEGLALTPRFEALYMPDGFESRFDYTLTARYVKGSVTNWLELRSDASTLPVFQAPPKDPLNQPYSELTLTWGAAVKF